MAHDQQDQPAGMVGNMFSELRRRRVFRVATAYAVVAFVVLQLGEITFEPLQLPNWSLRALIIVVVLGFPLAMALAWIFDWTADGIVRTHADKDSRKGVAILLLLGVFAVDGLFAYYLYRIYAPGVMGTDSPVVDRTGVASTDPGLPDSIAVMPFTDLSENGDQGHFSDGIAEEILNVLTAIDGLNVQARTSSFALRDAGLDARQIGRTLGVSHVLAGSVRKQGDKVRISTQLIDAASGSQEWSRTYDRDLVDVFEIQDEIAREIGNELLGTTMVADPEPLMAAVPASMEAWEEYLQARKLLWERTETSLLAAAERFVKTIEIDQSFALAYAGLADTYLLLHSYGNLPLIDAIQKAQPLIDAALRLDGQSSEAFASLGLLYRMLGHLDRAENRLREAIRHDEDNTVAYVWLAGVLAEQGRLGEERAILDLALANDPINVLLNLNMAGNDFRRGDPGAGFRRLFEILDVYPTSTPLLRNLAQWEAQYNRHADALAHLKMAERANPGDPLNSAAMAGIWLDLDQMQNAEKQLARARELAPDSDNLDFLQASYLLASGRYDGLHDLAAGVLERTADQVGSTKSQVAPHLWMGLAALRTGDADQALLAIDQAMELPIDSPWMRTHLLSWAAAMTTDDDRRRDYLSQATEMIVDMEINGHGDPGFLYLAATVAALSGEPESALDRLGQATVNAWISPRELSRDERLESITEMAEFESLLTSLQDRKQRIVGELEDQAVALITGAPAATQFSF